MHQITCSELNIVKNQANAVVLLLTVKIPKLHVRPSRGRRTMVATNMALYDNNSNSITMSAP